MLNTYLSAKMSFSVMPRSDVPHAKTNIMIPNDVWIGMYDALRWDARPGNMKVMNPPTHYKIHIFSSIIHKVTNYKTFNFYTNHNDNQFSVPALQKESR